jgi:uncharacterized protein (TIGR02147 family)
METDYRDFLTEAFHSRRSKDRKYSLRAFAKDIGMSAPKLSQNLRGLCGMSSNKAQEIATRLQMPVEVAKKFVMLVEARHGRSVLVRERANLELKMMSPPVVLRSGDSRAPLTWYQSAILSLVNATDFQPEAEWFSLRLNISKELVMSAIETLKADGLLETTGSTWHRKDHEPVSVAKLQDRVLN